MHLVVMGEKLFSPGKAIEFPIWSGIIIIFSLLFKPRRDQQAGGGAGN